MFIFWTIVGAIIGGTLGWLFDRRFMKRDDKDQKTQEEKAPT